MFVATLTIVAIHPYLDISRLVGWTKLFVAALAIVKMNPYLDISRLIGWTEVVHRGIDYC